MKEKSNIEKWVEGGFSQELLDKLKKEYPNDIDLQKAEPIVNSVQYLQPDYKLSIEELWKRIEDKSGRKVISINRQKTKALSKWRVVAAALVIIAMLGSVALWNIFINNSNDEIFTAETRVAETLKLELPDKSEVFVNASTEIEYNKLSWSESRTIKLKGEAFFKVVKGNSFIVETDLGTVTVLGTSFNVKSRDNILIVSCKTGRVRVSIKNGETTELTSGTSARFEKGKGLRQTNVTSSHIDSWIKGNFYFENTPVKEVFKEFENQFNTKLLVEKESIFEKRYTGFFNINNDIGQAVDGICLPLKLCYEISEDKKEIKVSN